MYPDGLADAGGKVEGSSTIRSIFGENTRMLFGGAKESLPGVIGEFKA